MLLNSFQQDVAQLLPRMKEQASTATTTTHPLFMTPFTPDKLQHEMKKLLPDKSPGPYGITHRMLQAGDFQGLILIFFNGSGNFTHNPQTGNSVFYNPYTKDTTRTKQPRTQHPAEASAGCWVRAYV